MDLKKIQQLTYALETLNRANFKAEKDAYDLHWKLKINEITYLDKDRAEALANALNLAIVSTTEKYKKALALELARCAKEQ